MSFKIGKALTYAVLLWLIGFVWGSIVFVTPGMKSVAPITYVSRNPVISFPILFVWLIITYLIARIYLTKAADRVSQGLKLGIVFSVMNFVLDLLLLVMLLKAGISYFVSVTVWIGYFILLAIPWIVGRSLHRKTS